MTVALTTVLKTIVEQYGEEKILQALSCYLDFCARGMHVRNGQNMGYKDLPTFMTRLDDFFREKKRLWWDVEVDQTAAQKADPNNAITVRLADSFAMTFMESDRYPFDEHPEAYQDFRRATESMLAFMKKHVLDEDVAIRQALSLLIGKSREGFTANPRALARREFWVLDLPRHIQENP
jgi:hypothetical protein